MASIINNNARMMRAKVKILQITMQAFLFWILNQQEMSEMTIVNDDPVI